MKKEIIVTAKTTAEAIEKAVAELGAPSVDAIEYTVIEEAKKGLFGIGAAPAKVQASYTVKGVYVALEMIKKVDLTQQVIALRSLEALEKVADGKATKIIVPSEIQNVASLVASVAEVANRDAK